MAGEQLPPSNPIATLNDAFRQQFNDWYISSDVQTLPDFPDLIHAVQTFDKFTTTNDPYGEHDYGAIVWRGVRTIWRIYYYDQQLQNWSDPLSEECRRVLTVMLASEY